VETVGRWRQVTWLSVSLRVMGSAQARGRRDRLVLHGELGEPFGLLFWEMQMDGVVGTAVLTGNVIGRAHSCNRNWRRRRHGAGPAR
jgi:hypothetical protein